MLAAAGSVCLPAQESRNAEKELRFDGGGIADRSLGEPLITVPAVYR